MPAASPLASAPDEQTAEFAGWFLEAQLSPRTRRSYSSDLAGYFVWLKERGVHPLQARRNDIDAYRNWLTQELGPDGRPSEHGKRRFAQATAARRLATVRSFYSYLVAQRILDGSPAVSVRSPKVPREPRGKALTEDQLRRLLETAGQHSPEADAMVCLMAFNGLRVAEVCRADVEDLETLPGGGQVLQVRGKGDKLASVPLNARTEAAVARNIQGRVSGPLLRRPADRRRRAGTVAPLRPFNQPAAGRLLNGLGLQAGIVGPGPGQIPSLHPHRLRHTFVTLLLDRGVPLAVVQDAARHSQADTTRLYDRARDDHEGHPTHELMRM